MSAHPDFDRLERLITTVMRAGVALSSSTLLAGLVLTLAGAPIANAVLNAGLIVLMLIPATRIVVSLADAVIRKDSLLGFATLFVTILLTLQILGVFDRLLQQS
jgi:uncharacterized membrane protein